MQIKIEGTPEEVIEMIAKLNEKEVMTIPYFPQYEPHYWGYTNITCTGKTV